MNKAKMSFLGMLFLIIGSIAFSSCSFENTDDEKIVEKNVKQQNTQINQPQNEHAYISYSLSEFKNQTVTINFSAEMKVENNSGKDAKLMWQIMKAPYPVIAEHTFAPGTTDFTLVKTDKNPNDSNKDIFLEDGDVLYLSTYETDASKIKIELKNVCYTVSYKISTGTKSINWLEDSVPSLYQTFKNDFEYVGMACEYSSWAGVKELVNDSVCKGLQKHANTITMGNEFKPDGFFPWGFNGNNTRLVDFKASNGMTIKVPESLNFSTVDNCLSQCKKFGLQMRGHVLVWHSQTPENFFAKNYVANIEGEKITNLVSKEEMCARQEWYIKSVLEHVKKWEEENNDGKHIIWAWDVVNEAMADDANSSNWIRGSTASTEDKAPKNGGSRWYQIYKNEDFIVDAFRFANAYAPSDVKLCYNDYNEYKDNKTQAICKIIDKIQNGTEKTVNGKSVKPRIDAMGMQSHVSVTWPGINGYENAIKQFLKKGINIHVTELDINNGTEKNTANSFGEYYRLFTKYGKDYGKNHIECVTLWGINNKSSWISKETRYPLLFDDFKTTSSFWKVIEQGSAQ